MQSTARPCPFLIVISYLPCLYAILGTNLSYMRVLFRASRLDHKKIRFHPCGNKVTRNHSQAIFNLLRSIVRCLGINVAQFVAAPKNNKVCPTSALGLRLDLRYRPVDYLVQMVADLDRMELNPILHLLVDM